MRLLPLPLAGMGQSSHGQTLLLPLLLHLLLDPLLPLEIPACWNSKGCRKLTGTATLLLSLRLGGEEAVARLKQQQLLLLLMQLRPVPAGVPGV